MSERGTHSLVATTCALDCQEGTTYVKILKQNMGYSSEESYSISNASGVLVQSITLTDNVLQTFEYCLSNTPNSQYTLKLMDSYGDSWASGSWLEARGIYDNTVFKNMMTDPYQEVYTLSLYYAILKNASWKMSSSASGTWTEFSFDDSTWTSVTLGSTSTEVSGAQFFRKTFTGLADMAAYDLRLNYMEGIVAYVNGVEIFRDNLAAGPVSSSTVAAGAYAAYEYRGVMRPGMEVSAAQSVLAVGLFFTTASNPVSFDAFMALLAPSTVGAPCALVAANVTVSGSYPDVMDSFDFDRDTYLATPLTDEGADVFMAFTANPFVNGLRIWPSSSAEEAPSTFTWSGKNSEADYTAVMSTAGLSYQNERDQFAFAYFHGGLYRNYKLHVSGTASGTLSLYELHPLVCAISVPQSIAFTAATFTALVNYDEVSIRPVVSDFHDCTLQPALPAGVTFTAATCSLSGVPTAVLAATVFTMTSTLSGQSYTGSFTLEVKSCAHTIVDLRRVYLSAATSEFFHIRNSANELVYAIQAGTTQEADTTTHTYLCLPADVYTVTLESHALLWIADSFLYVDALFSEDDKETVLRARFDSLLGLNTAEFSTVYPVPAAAQWKYKMGEVPAGWQTGDVSAWAEAAKDSFPDSSNNLQLYRKSFNVATLEGFAGVVLSLRYRFGCVVYLNGHEVFRNGVAGELSTASVAENIYDSTKYHVISLPLQAVVMGSTQATQYVQQGANTIAVALVSTSSSRGSDFDCAVRLMVDGEARVLEGYAVSSNLYGNPMGVFDDCSDYYVYQNNCYGTATLDISFEDDRRECVTAVIVQLQAEQMGNYLKNFVFQGRNTDSEAWTTLRTVAALGWSQKGQAKRILIPNHVAYNQYRFTDFNKDQTSCQWEAARFSLLACNANANVPDLKYVEAGEEVAIYKNIEMAEIFPNSDEYLNFVIQPELPAGVSMDPNTGMISGTATAEAALVVYTITASKFNGETKTATLPLKVMVCAGDRSLVTLVARTDTWPHENYFKLYEGRGTGGTVKAQGDGFPVANALNYADWCLPHAIYTVELGDTANDGWVSPAGWYLSVDVGAMKFEMGQVPNEPKSVSTVFSSYFPFQVEYSDWAVSKTGVAGDWNSVSFDASAWQTVKAAAIGTNNEITTYIRKEFSIPSLEDYQVLNVRVKYTGGVVVYVNGHKVARFNLEEGFDKDTQSIEAKAEPVFSVFHVILNTVQAATDKNVIAFEVHRPKDTSSEVPVVFDATGVFGVNECSVVLDSYSSISEGYENYFDLSPVTFRTLENSVGTAFEWTVENLEGSRFNAYAWQTSVISTGWGFSLYARRAAEEEYLTAFEALGQQTLHRARAQWDVPVGIAGFRQFKHVVDAAASSPVVGHGVLFLYCKASGAVCPGVGEYPTVAEGQMSPAACAEGFHGYSYRNCSNGQLSEVHSDRCLYNLPSNLTYYLSEYLFVIDTEVSTGAPAFTNLITEFFLDEACALPAGVTLDSRTGEIRGKPTAAMEKTTLTIHGKNPEGATFTTVTISVRKGLCYPEGSFGLTEVGETASYNCALDGNYVGTRTRACVLGERDGEWQNAKGFCTSVMMIVVLVVVALVIIIIVLLVVIRVMGKKKAVGGKRGAVKTMKVAKGAKGAKNAKGVKV